MMPLHMNFTVREQLGHIMLATYSELEPQQTESCIHQNINSVRVAAILSFIEQHYPENITLSNIAEIVNISERETLRCFKKSHRRISYPISVKIQIDPKCICTNGIPG